MDRKGNRLSLVHQLDVFRYKRGEEKQMIEPTWAPWCSTTSSDAAPATLNPRALETVP